MFLLLFSRAYIYSVYVDSIPNKILCVDGIFCRIGGGAELLDGGGGGGGEKAHNAQRRRVGR